MKKSSSLLLAILLFAAAIWAAVPLRTRWQWEKDASVEICLDGEELRALYPGGGALSDAIARLARSGVSSVAVHWDASVPLETVLSTWTARLPEGLAVALRPRAGPFSGGAGGLGAPLPAGSPARHVLFSGPAVPGYPDVSKAMDWIAASSANLPWVEFTRQGGARALAGRFPDRVVRAHGIDEDEMARSAPAQAVSRFRRAVRERGIRFLYVRLFPGLSAAANESYVASLGEGLLRDGFRLEPALPRRPSWPGAPDRLPVWLRQGLALALACLAPAWVFRRAAGRPHPFFSPVVVTAANVGVALFAAALLSAPEFALGLHGFRGVKAALIIPLALAALSLYPPKELRRILDRPVTVGAALAAAAAALALAVYVARSGHDGFIAAGAAEQRARGLLEGLFGVRPRFKEFLVGHPFLWLGFYALSRRNALPGDPRPLALIGFIGQLSLVNTFCHPHVPLSVSLWRTFHGIWLGALGGGLLIALARRAWGRGLPA